jgi:hypothetical protein
MKTSAAGRGWESSDATVRCAEVATPVSAKRIQFVSKVRATAMLRHVRLDET